MSGSGERGGGDSKTVSGAVDKATVLYGKSRRVMGEGAQWK